MSEQTEFLVRQLPNLVFGFPGNRPGGLAMSILLTLSALALGFLVATGVGLGHHSRWSMVRAASRLYVRLIRGVPLILLLVLVHQFTSTGRLLGLETSTLGSALVALTLYSSAYQADLIQTGVAAMPQQLIDDARLLGAGRFKLTRTLTLPFSLKAMRPALEGQAVTVFKDSSVVVVLGVADLTTNARIALGGDVTNAPFWLSTYLVVGFLYFVTAFGISHALARFQLRTTSPNQQRTV